jgi:hypothetical protein
MPGYSRRQVLPLLFTAAAMPSVAAAMPGVDAAAPAAPAARYRGLDIRRAIRRGMQFLQRVADADDNFNEFGNDAVWTFLDLSRTADPDISQRARSIGQEFARRWLRENSSVPRDADASTLDWICGGLYACTQIGVPAPRLKEQLQAAALRFTPKDFLKFDPLTEAVPTDLCERCANCGTRNRRGRLTCIRCGALVKFTSPYDTLTGALVSAYTWERMGVSMGATLADVTQHVPRMKPWRGFENGRNNDFTQTCYAVTHVVYVFDDYFNYRLKPEWLPDEYKFLQDNLTANLANGDADLMGEFLDSLKAFNVTDADPLIRTGIDFLLRLQNDDGSWSEEDESGVFTLFHATSTALNGLSDWNYQGEQVTFPEALRRLYGKEQS